MTYLNQDQISNLAILYAKKFIKHETDQPCFQFVRDNLDTQIYKPTPTAISEVADLSRKIIASFAADYILEDFISLNS